MAGDMSGMARYKPGNHAVEVGNGGVTTAPIRSNASAPSPYRKHETHS